MICPYCQKPAKWCENKEAYGRNYGRSYMCYYCKPCDAYVGCHNNTKTPLGTMANKQLRIARMEAHKVFDELWLYGKYTRKSAYDLLKRYFKREIHIGKSDIDMCNKIIRFINKTK